MDFMSDIEVTTQVTTALAILLNKVIKGFDEKRNETHTYQEGVRCWSLGDEF